MRDRVFVTKRRDRIAALEFLKRAMKRYGRPRSIVNDRLRSYRSAMKLIGNAADQECGRWLNNRAEGVVTLSQTERNLPTTANVDESNFKDLACWLIVQIVPISLNVRLAILFF